MPTTRTAVPIRWLAFGTDDLRAAIRITETALEAELVAMRARHDRAFEEAAEKSDDGPNTADIIREHYSYRLLIPIAVRRSLFVTIFSLVEHWLVECCHTSKEWRGITKPFVADRDVLEEAKRYLKREAGIEFPSGGLPWKRLRIYGLARNAVVHNGGVAKDQDAQEFNSLPGLSLSGRTEIYLSAEFCPAMLKCVDDFMADLRAAWERRMYGSTSTRQAEDEVPK
jgi:hypothetical protein